MIRVSETRLRRAINDINNVLGKSTETWSDGPEGMKAVVGNYHLSKNFRNWSMDQNINETGGVIVVLMANTKTELYYKIEAFLAGVVAAKRAS